MANLATGMPVGIHLETHVKQDGETTDYLLDVEGQIIQIGRTIYLRYQEPQDGPTSEEVPVTIKFRADGDVSLTRSGENRLRMHFSAGKRIAAHYKTPYGIVPVETVTPHLNVAFHDRPFGGRLSVDYRLYAGEQLLGNYSIRLQFTV